MVKEADRNKNKKEKPHKKDTHKQDYYYLYTYYLKEAAFCSWISGSRIFFQNQWALTSPMEKVLRPKILR